MNMKNKIFDKKSRKEFVAGFTAGAVGIGFVAFILLLMFYL